jgi:hypothetical protein
MKGRVRLRISTLAASASWLAVPLVWSASALLAAMLLEMPLIPAKPRPAIRPIPELQERARQPEPPSKPRDKPVDFAPWEEVPT